METGAGCAYIIEKKLTNDAVSFSLCLFLKLLILRRVLAVYASVGAGKRVDDVHVVFIKREIKTEMFSSWRSGDADFGIGMAPSWICQRKMT